MKKLLSMSLLSLVGGLGLSLSAAPLPTPILEYLFNETGVTAANTGSNTSSLTMRSAVDGTFNVNGPGVDLHGAANSGVSGLSSDRAFNNSAANNMGSHSSLGGSYAHGGTATSSSLVSAITLESFTLTGWFKTDGIGLSGSARILDGNASQFALTGETGGIGLTVNGTKAFHVNSVYQGVSQWVFFAVSYDGALSENNVKFYAGSQSNAVSLLATLSLAPATDSTLSLAGRYTVGNNGGGIRPFDGLLDNIRLYGSDDEDASGVLDLATLEAVRFQDTGMIPEPSSYAMLAGLAILGLALTRRGVAVRR